MNNPIHIRKLKNGRLQPVHIPIPKIGTARKFYAIERRDTATPFVQALLRAGFVEADNAKIADFILYANEPSGSRAERLYKYIGEKPVFIYPHTTYAYWFWDGFIKPKPCACNFVVGEAAVKSMEAYGYPYRTEAVGFPRCPVLPFKPTTGKHLYYSSARLLGSKGAWPDKASKELHTESMNWLTKNRQYFDRVTVALQFNLKTAGLDKFTKYGFEFQEVGNPALLSTATAMPQFSGADIVISFNTFAHLAVANGIPTVIVGKLRQIVNRHYKLEHHDLYKQWFDFPLDLFSMSGQDVLNLRERPNELVEEWKRQNIGQNFNADKFISVVKEFI